MGSNGAFFRRLRDSLAQGPVALMTVVEARGSTPRIAGARQFLSSAGESCGSVGGGITESRVMKVARETLADGRSRVFHADLRGNPDDMRDGVCGGTMTVWIAHLGRARMLATVESLAESLNSGRHVLLSTQCGGDLPLTIHDVDATALSDEESFVQVIDPAPALLIVGAGHIGRALARLASDLEFVVTVQDDRNEWLVKEAFPASCALDSSLHTALEGIRQWQSGRFATLVTRGFAQDVEALKLLRGVSDWEYIGLLGSKRRVARVLAGQEAWPAGVLHAPTGIEIGAETPMEIAVSIAAEMIQALRKERECAQRDATRGWHSQVTRPSRDEVSES